jgi:hypothetical protein
MSTPPAHFLTHATHGLARYADHLTRHGLHETLIEQLAGAHRLQRDVQFLNLTQAVAESFDGLSPAQIEAVSDAVYAAARGTLAMDHLVDEPHGANAAWETVVQFQLTQTLLSEIFPAGHAFWPHFAALQREHFVSMHDERRCTPETAPEPMVFARIAQAKATLVRLPVLALGQLANASTEAMSALGEALAWEQVAMQWKDDLADVADDLTHGQITLVTQRLRTWCQANDEPLPTATDEVKALVHRSGVSIAMLQDIADALLTSVRIGGRYLPATYRDRLLAQEQRSRRVYEELRSCLVEHQVA